MDYSELEQISEKDMFLAIGLHVDVDFLKEHSLHNEKIDNEIKEFKYEISSNNFIKIMNYICNNIELIKIK